MYKVICPVPVKFDTESNSVATTSEVFAHDHPELLQGAAVKPKARTDATNAINRVRDGKNELT